MKKNELIFIYKELKKIKKDALWYSAQRYLTKKKKQEQYPLCGHRTKDIWY